MTAFLRTPHHKSRLRWPSGRTRLYVVEKSPETIAKEKLYKYRKRTHLDKYATAKMPKGWRVDDLMLVGKLFSVKPVPYDTEECATWCMFCVTLRRKTNSRERFTFCVKFDWEEEVDLSNSTASHVNLRAVAEYRLFKCTRSKAAQLREAAIDTLLTKYAYLRYRCSMRDIDLDKVISKARLK